MHSHSGNHRFASVIFLLICFASLALAQETALLSTMKGKVLVKKTSGQTEQGCIRMQLSQGDVVSTSKGASATIMYYTGREVYLEANRNYTIANDKGEEPFLRRLTSVFLNLLWSNKPSKSVLGASRSWKEGGKRVIMGIYPALNVLPDSVIRFEWIDSNPKLGRKYEVVIRDDDGRTEKVVTAIDTSVVTVHVGGVVLSFDARHRWRVRDLQSGQESEETVFSFLTGDQRENLAKSLTEIRATCAQDDARRYLLEALLYTDSGLMRQAESSLMKFIDMRPDEVVGHELLAQVYANIGRYDKSIVEQDLVKTMLNAK